MRAESSEEANQASQTFIYLSNNLQG